ncbi:glycosyltransferase [Flavisericum labens]|uniref:glycosyltransferase n=1 Tax=Flavisericum labens TaxID=3377112 RepID=UPI00387B1941
MKTICFVVPAFPVISETFVVNQILVAKQLGYAIKILTQRILPISASSQQELLEQEGLMDNVTELGYKIPKNKFERRIRALSYILTHFVAWNQVLHVQFRKRFSTLPFQMLFFDQFKDVDVFHVQFAQAGMELAKMKSIGVINAEVITTFHGYDAHFKNKTEQDKLTKRYKELLKLSSSITVNTTYLASIVKKIGVEEAKLHIIPMGVDVNFFYNEKDRKLHFNKKVKLLSVGRLVSFKGFKYSIYAVKQVVDAGYDVIYTIAGEGQEEKDLKSLIETLDLKAHVIMLGKQTQNQVKALMQNHDIFVMSSIADSTGRQETQGVVTAEAQAMGLPVVAFKSGGVPYTISDKITGYLVEEKDTDALAQAVINILEMPDSYQKMSESAREYAVKEFSNAIMGQRFKMLYG